MAGRFKVIVGHGPFKAGISPLTQAINEKKISSPSKRQNLNIRELLRLSAHRSFVGQLIFTDSSI